MLNIIFYRSFNWGRFDSLHWLDNLKISYESRISYRLIFFENLWSGLIDINKNFVLRKYILSKILSSILICDKADC